MVSRPPSRRSPKSGKNRVLTSTNGLKLTDLLSASTDLHLRATDDELLHVISQDSTKDGLPHEIADGDSICVLHDTPVGNTTFCKSFISKAMSKMREHSKTILDCLPSRQSMLQLYKLCVSQKMTHLFGADVLTEKKHSRNWNTWDSVLCSDFNDTRSHYPLPLIPNKTIPELSVLLASVTTKQGGLGIQHPRSTAIPAYFLTMKRNIQCATEGIWTNHHTSTIDLPGHLRSLYRDWQDSPLPSLAPFQKYYQDSKTIYASEQIPDQDSFILLQSSTNRCKEEIKKLASRRIKVLIYHIVQSNDNMSTFS